MKIMEIKVKRKAKGIMKIIKIQIEKICMCIKIRTQIFKKNERVKHVFVNVGQKSNIIKACAMLININKKCINSQKSGI